MIRNLAYDGDWSDGAALAEALAASGLGDEACRAKARLLTLAAAALPKGNDSRRTAFFVPGRIEVLGKHTDYAGGSSIVAAVEQGFCLVARGRTDRRVTATSATGGETIDFALDGDLVPTPGHWGNYPMTTARRVARNFAGPLLGADVAFASYLPPAAGMSSSSAMMVGFFLALDGVNRLASRPEFRQNISEAAELAGYLGTVENGQTFGTLEGDRGVGTFGGSEDHTAILCSRPGAASRYAYCPVRFERSIAVPRECVFAVGTSGVVAEKTGAARDRYNAASRLAFDAAALWRRETGRDDPHLGAILASGAAVRDRLGEIIESAAPEAERLLLLARLAHFAVENGQVLPAAADALEAVELDTFGRLVDRSQEVAERLLGNQVPETIHLAASARRAGALAASAFGAGFGGSVWALVEAARADAFLKAWAGAYRERFGGRAEASRFFLTGAGGAAFQVG